MESCPAEFIATAERLADAGGDVVRRYFRQPVTVDEKSDESPVTIADREAETAMRALISEAYPDHGIIGEEHGAERSDAEFVWVLDPIDGTKAFLTGKPFFGTLIALVRNRVPVLGIIDQPISRERWIGAVGQPTTLNGAPISVRACPGLDQAILNTTGPDLFPGNSLSAFTRVSNRVKRTLYGGDCYQYGLLATGFIDLVVEAGLKPYDFCALIPVIQGAGGIVTDWSGAPLTTASDGTVVAAGDRAVHKQALDLLSPGAA